MREKVKDKKSVFITYSQYCHGGEVCAGEENDRWASHEPEYCEVTLGEIMLVDEYRLNGDSIEVTFNPERYINKPLYVVFVLYTTGSTFGSTSGNPYFPAVFTSADPAFEMEAQIRDGKYEGYAPWKGYFESLDSVEVVVKRLLDNRSPKA